MPVSAKQGKGFSLVQILMTLKMKKTILLKSNKTTLTLSFFFSSFLIGFLKFCSINSKVFFL